METAFLFFVGAVAAAWLAVVLRYLQRPDGTVAIAGFAIWLAYAGSIGYFGVVANRALVPPGMIYLLAPMAAFIMFMVRSRAGGRIAAGLPLWLPVTAESFRLIVEIFLDALWRRGLLPTTMTFHGANYDIVIGLSVPLVAWLLATERIGYRWAIAWNAAGIAMLANVAVRGVLTTPGFPNVIATEVPNVAVGIFPFTYIPGLMVPLALLLHVLSIRALRRRLTLRPAAVAGVEA